MKVVNLEKKISLYQSCMIDNLDLTYSFFNIVMLFIKEN